MRKRWLFIAIIALGLIAYLGLWRAEDIFRHPSPRASPKIATQTSQAQPKSPLRVPAQVPADTNTDATDTADAKDADSKCWDQINEQVAENRYIDSIKSDLEVGEWFYKKDVPLDHDETSNAGRFFQALAEAGLLQGRTLEQKPEHAMSLLQEVAKADSDNSAPLVFAALIAHKLGDEERATQLTKAANTRAKFESYTIAFNREALRHIRTPLDYIEAVSVTSSTPIADFGQLNGYLKKVDAKNVAAGMIRNYPGRDENGKPPQFDVDWFPIEYSIGASLMRIYDPKFNVASSRDLMKASVPVIDADDFWQSPSKHGCRLESFQSQVDELREHLNR